MKKMKKQLCFLFILLTTPVFVNAQDTSFPQGELMIMDGDSIPTYGIPLKEVVLFQPLRFKNTIRAQAVLNTKKKNT